MIDRENLVGFVERALLLKTLPVLSDASPDQLAAIVSRVQDRSFMPGATLFRAGEYPTQLQVILEGRARQAHLGGVETRTSGDVVGLLDALEQRPHATSCISETPVHTLALRVDEFFDLLEDFFDLSRALLAYLARHVTARIDADGAPFVARSQPLDLVDKIVFMKSVPVLAGASIDELVRLGKEVAEVTYAKGDVVTRVGDPADAFYLVLRGRLGDRGPRSGVAHLDVLRQDGFRQTLVATEPSRVLRVPAERYFDLLEDHFDLALAVARRLSGAVRGQMARRERATIA